MGDSDKPNPRQELFCHEYLKDLNGTQAAIRAGYTEDPDAAAVQASRLLSNAKVRAQVEELKEARNERIQISADYVLGSLIEVAERCMERAPVMVKRGKEVVQKVDEDGNHVWTFNAHGANKALELLGKHKKLFADRVEHSGVDGKPIEISPVQSSEQIDARIQALLEKLQEKKDA